jgi:hypothetical protein
MGCGLFLLTGWFVSYLMPSVSHAPRPIAAAVATLASLGVLVFTLSGVVVLARGSSHRWLLRRGADSGARDPAPFPPDF